MPIVTKPSTVEKNVVAQFTLDKSALASVASVVADSYFSDMLNWSEVLIYYKSSEGNQREILKFDATLASPTASFLVSDKARDIFEVQKIVIKDFDNGSFTVERTELVAAEFDVDMSGGGSGGGGGSGITWTTTSGELNINESGDSIVVTGVINETLRAMANTPIVSGGFSAAISTASLGDMIVGILGNNQSSTIGLGFLGFYIDSTYNMYVICPDTDGNIQFPLENGNYIGTTGSSGSVVSMVDLGDTMGFGSSTYQMVVDGNVIATIDPLALSAANLYPPLTNLTVYFDFGAIGQSANNITLG